MIYRAVCTSRISGNWNTLSQILSLLRRNEMLYKSVQNKKRACKIRQNSLIETLLLQSQNFNPLGLLYYQRATLSWLDFQYPASFVCLPTIKILGAVFIQNYKDSSADKTVRNYWYQNIQFRCDLVTRTGATCGASDEQRPPPGQLRSPLQYSLLLSPGS